MNKAKFVLLFIVLVCALFPAPAYANSSWHWLTKTNPFDILPYVTVATLLIEYFAIKILNQIRKAIMLFAIVCGANLASFLLPFGLLWIVSINGLYTFKMSINNLPTYIIGLGYLFLTLAVEVPILYFCFRNRVSNKKKLMITIIAVNVVTTAMVAIVERIVCPGSW